MTFTSIPCAKFCFAPPLKVVFLTHNCVTFACKRKASLMLPTVKKTAETAKKNQRLIFSRLKKIPSTNKESPSNIFLQLKVKNVRRFKGTDSKQIEAN